MKALRRLAYPFRRSLLVRLVGWFLGLSLVTLVLVTVAAFQRSREALTRAVASQLAALAEDRAAEVERWLEEQRGDLEFLASLPNLNQARLDAAAAQALDVEELMLLSAVGGRTIASTTRARVGEYRVNDRFFARGRDSTFVQGVYPSATTARPTVTIATPVHDARGRLTAVLAAHLNFARIDATIAYHTGLGPTSEAYLVSPLNDFVSAERFGDPRWRRGVHTEGVRRALAGDSGSARYRNYAGVPVIGAWRLIEPLDIALLVEVPEREALVPARRGAGTVLLVGAVSLLLLAFAMVAVARRIVKPVLAVADAATRVAGGDFRARAPVITSDEVGRLARNFNHMTARLRSLVEDLHDQVDATTDALRALEESRSLLQALVVHSSNGIAVFDRDGRFLLVNERFGPYLGVDGVHVIGRMPAESLPPPAGPVYADLARRALEGRRGERDITLPGLTAPRSLHLSAFPLLDAERRTFGAGLIAVDLTERRRAEEERQRLDQRVQHAQRLESLGLLAGGIAHDFNNLLAAILAHATLVRDQLPEDAPARDDLAHAIAATEHAAQLTHQLLAYAGKASLAVTSFDLNDAVRDLTDLLQVSLPKHVHLERHLAGAPVPVRADPGQVQQVILNLLTNAAEAVEAGGRVTLTTRTRTDAAGEWEIPPGDADGWAELVVTNDGPGIDGETRARIFDPFFSTKATGRGLGLAAVLGIVKASGGTLGIATAQHRGTRITVLLPGGTLVEPAAVAPAAETPAAAGRGITVLLADDEKAVRRAASRILTRGGFTVLAARDGREAAELFARNRDSIRVVILDVTMPRMGGRDAYAAIRAEAPRMPVIFSSGYDKGDVQQTASDPHVSFLAKPYRAETLVARVQAAVGSAEPG